jgi:HSP20 family protein
MKTDTPLKVDVTDELAWDPHRKVQIEVEEDWINRTGEQPAFSPGFFNPSQEIHHEQPWSAGFSSSDSFASAMRSFFAPVPFETETPALSMRINLSEKEGAYVLKADIPGVRKEDIKVRIDGKVVRIDAQVRRDRDANGDGDRVLRSERCWGQVSRSLCLAQAVDDAKVQARYVDGVLMLELPKKATAESKNVTSR